MKSTDSMAKAYVTNKEILKQAIENSKKEVEELEKNIRRFERLGEIKYGKEEWNNNTKKKVEVKNEAEECKKEIIKEKIDKEIEASEEEEEYVIAEVEIPECESSAARDAVKKAVLFSQMFKCIYPEDMETFMICVSNILTSDSDACCCCNE